jgi:hypothetical protein
MIFIGAMLTSFSWQALPARGGAWVSTRLGRTRYPPKYFCKSFDEFKIL